MSAQDRAIATSAERPAASKAAEVVDIGETSRLAARRRERLMSIGSPLGLLLAWELAGRFGFIDVRFFPAPTHDHRRAHRARRRSGELVEHVAISLQRIALGFLLGGIPAVIIGISMGISRPVRALIDPLISATFPIPKSATPARSSC